MSGADIFDFVYMFLIGGGVGLLWWRCAWWAGYADLYWERSEEYRIAGETLERALGQRLTELTKARRELAELLEDKRRWGEDQDEHHEPNAFPF